MDIDLEFDSAEAFDLLEQIRLRRIGEFIKAEREAQHLTHEALSKKAGGTPAGGTISRIERAQSKKVKRDTLIKILKALGHLPEALDKLSEHTFIPGTVVFQGMIRILYGIHVLKNIPTKIVNEENELRDVPLRSWVRENWHDPVFEALPLGRAGYDQIWEVLEQHRYVKATESGDYIYDSPSDDEIATMERLFVANIVLLITALFEHSNEDDRRQSGATLQLIAKQFEWCSLSPELAKLAVKRFFWYLSKGVPSYASVLMQFLFIWDHALDREAYTAFGGSPGSEEVGRGLLRYQARVKCIHFTLMEYGCLVAHPDYVDTMYERLVEIDDMYNEYVRLVTQPGSLNEVLQKLKPPYLPRFQIGIADDGSGVPPMERARRAIPALRSIPDGHLVVTKIHTMTDREGENSGVVFDTDAGLSSSAILGSEIDPHFGFQVDSGFGAAYLNKSHVDYGETDTDCGGDENDEEDDNGEE